MGSLTKVIAGSAALAVVGTALAMPPASAAPLPDPLNAAVCYEYAGDDIVAGRFGVVPAVGSLVGDPGKLRGAVRGTPFPGGNYADEAELTGATGAGDGVRYWSAPYDGFGGNLVWTVGKRRRKTATMNLDYDASRYGGNRMECPAAPPPSDTCSTGAGTVIVDEDFDSIAEWDDLSTAVTWGDVAGSHSAWDLSGGTLRLDPASGPYAGYARADSLKTATAIDCQFAGPIAHRDNIVEIAFRGKWDELNKDESSRIVVALNHDYPADGLDMTLDGAISDFAEEAWARPAYHLRIRGGAMGATQPASTSMIQYGGGAVAAGEYETFSGGAGTWWLPGFISGAGGVSPGTAADFPANSWTRTQAGVTSTDWVDYRYVVTPTAQQFYVDDVLAAEMPLPETSTAPLYQYFEQFEGIRIYYRSPTGGATLDDLTVTVTPVDPPTDPPTDPVTPLAQGETLTIDQPARVEVSHDAVVVTRIR